jgi:hypothetical protein|tara:strand:+ start:557 stop:739 length:183 start_codon:yes stop_codon:yes gene_type:complete
MIKQLKTLIKSQRAAIVLLLILNLLQLRELGLMRIELIDLEIKIVSLEEHVKKNENESYK